MKKFLLLALCLGAVMMTACAQDSSSEESSQAQENSSVSAAADSTKADDSAAASSAEDEPSSVEVNDVITSYKVPADVLNIDLTKDDPSDDNVKFAFDENGLVKSYKYSDNGADILVTYTYEDNSVTIYTFSGEIIVDEQHFDYSSVDPSAGFTVQNGYFFKGIVF